MLSTLCPSFERQRERALSEMSEPTVVPQDLRQVLPNSHFEDISGDVPTIVRTDGQRKMRLRLILLS